MKPKNLLLTLLIFSVLNTTFCFAADFELRTSLRFLATYSDNPPFLGNSTDTSTAGVLRIMPFIRFSDSMELEINIVNDINRSTAFIGNSAFLTGGMVPEVYRHPELSWDWENRVDGSYSTVGISTIDIFKFQYSISDLEINLGRQPINLGTCYYFTPNDFFQPFSAQAFNRMYKPGVDALRMIYYSGELGEYSLIGVAGYDEKDNLDWEASAAVARALGSAGNFEWSGMAGKLAGRYFAGGGFQGEIGIIGVRGETNVSFPEENMVDDFVQLAMGIDHRWPNSLHVLAEYMFRSDGAGDSSEYFEQFLDPKLLLNPYLGRHYLALGINYELHPLVNTSVIAISNLEDPSAVLTGSLMLSMADEADMVAGIQYPIGEEPVSSGILPEFRSEYGLYPMTIFFEIRAFF